MNDDSDVNRRFPRAQEIRRINDPVALQQMLDETHVSVTHLETKLEFPPTDDPVWDRNTRNALAYGRSAIKAIQNHMRTLRVDVREEKSHAYEAAVAKAKAEKALATAERVKQEAELAAARAARVKVNHELQETHIRAKLLKSVSWHVCFVRAARASLPNDVLAKIEEAADADYLDRLQQEASSVVRSDN